MSGGGARPLAAGAPQTLLVDTAPARITIRIDESNGVFTDAEVTTIESGAGADTVIGGRAAETIAAGDDGDLVNAGPGDDTVFLGAGDDLALSGTAAKVVTWEPAPFRGTTATDGSADNLLGITSS